MSHNYPEHQGKYERTELTKVKNQLTWARKNLILAEHKVRDLEVKMAELVLDSSMTLTEALEKEAK